ncbi:hypothetical protein [Rhodococcus xishaensis]|uniref:Uncharacterized protein n=1 Tax=Rhodococcus xishaensis TaxID=2487364 RepID=A0A3S3B215_9NOCA|nr:hypothetical protein [Rhodococcus xishaensis]RVW01320.1 hypothetical protein EGT50_13980 [Rhodococcus xishaensis]
MTAPTDNSEHDKATDTDDLKQQGAEQKQETVKEEKQTRKSDNAEAARYRRQLRDTEAERDTLRDRVTAYERREAEQLAVELADPRDLWVAGIDLDDLRGDNGTIDYAKVAAAVDEVLAEHPAWGKTRTPKPDRRQGGGEHQLPAHTNWSNALRR